MVFFLLIIHFQGEGLGNAFLSHIAGCDAIFSMMRVFEDAEVTHVDGDVSAGGPQPRAQPRLSRPFPSSS